MATREEQLRQEIRNTNSLIELKRKIEALNDQEKKDLQEVYEARQRALELDSQRLDVLKALNEKILENQEIVKFNNEITSETAKIIAKTLEYENEKELVYRTRLGIVEEDIEQQRKLMQDLAKDSAGNSEELKKQGKNLDELEAKRKRLSALAENESNTARQSADSFGNLLNLAGIKTEKQQLTMIETIAAGKFNVEEFKESVEDFTNSGLGLERIQAAIGAKIFEETVKLMFAADGARASIEKLSSGYKELSTEVTNLSYTSGLAGVSANAQMEAFAALQQGTSNFTEMTAKQRHELADTVAQMTTMGASADTVTKNISIFTQALGMSANEANNTSRQLVSLAKNLGVSVSQVSSDFGQAANSMIVYGKGAVDQFAKLSAQSKALGVSVQELIGIVNKADTFQGAAEQAGKLNAILGGGLLNSSQLLTASESERVEMIRNAVIESGRSFDQLGKYEKIAIANAAGISDMTVAQKLFNSQLTQAELDQYMGKTSSLSESQAMMQERALASATAMEKMQVLLQQLAIGVTPLVMALTDLTEAMVLTIGLFSWIAGSVSAALKEFEYYTEVMGFLGTVLKGATLILGFLFTAIFLVRGAMVIWSTITAATNAVFAVFNMNLTVSELLTKRSAFIFFALATVIGYVYNAITKRGSPPFYLLFGVLALGIAFSGEMINKYKSAYLAFGAAILMVGTGAFMAFYGLEGFSKALSSLNPAQLTTLAIVIGVMAVALVALFAAVLYAGTPAIVPLLALGAAFLMVGAGVGMAGAGMSLFVESLSGLTFETVQAVIGLSVALGLLNLSLISIGTSFTAFAVPILGAISMIALLASTINSIMPEKSIALKTTVDSVKDIAVASTQLTTDNVDNLERVVNQIHKLNVETTIAKTINVAAPFKELIEAITGQTGAVTAAANAKQQTNVIMKLNDREFGKAVIDVLNDRGTSNTVIKKA